MPSVQSPQTHINELIGLRLDIEIWRRVYGRPCSDQGQWYRKRGRYIAPEKITGDYLTDPQLENGPVPSFHLNMDATVDAARYAAQHHDLRGYAVTLTDRQPQASAYWDDMDESIARGDNDAEALARALLKGLLDGS